MSPDKSTRDFLRHRSNDPSSYFGKGNGAGGGGNVGKSKISPF